ncbi:MAG: ribonuclease Y [Thermodesulfovibrionales bacterium]|jgi:ribonuclease Y|nr:ribonuclease Y [Nitrospirota bacterium]MDP3259411.1 ribonuclease Y [Thermodesulfovibrionales bacterium]
MIDTAYLVLIAVGVGVGVGVIMGFIYRSSLKPRQLDIEKEKIKLFEEAKKEAETRKKEASLEAKDIVYQAKAEAEKDLKERRSELNQLDKRLRQKEETLDRKFDQIDKREHDLTRREKEYASKERAIQEKDNRYNQMLKEQTLQLERISGTSSEEAKAELFKRVEEESRFEAAKLAKTIEDEVKETAEKKAKETISFAIQRYASEYVADATASAVSLPNDEMKGRIIGREGRNIRALEAATGVDLLVDDTPELVTLSAFDPVRREIARISLERLIADGRIHPTRIEEIVEKVKKEIEANIREEGEKAVFDIGLSGIHPEIIKLLGRLKYRTSYGQPVLQHSKEVAYLAGMMAGELGIDVKLAKRAGLLHDIGKAVDHEVEGSHQEIGANIAKKHGENPKVVNAIMVHHGEGDPITAEAALVAAADALSAARPGVRRESIENYLKRLENLEKMAMSYKGVEKCYAIQAGREIRIIVRPEDMTDDMSAVMSKDLAKKIEAEMTYPGQIKVTVIRESRYVEYAK